mmetsp:Transcript_139520/g.256591  ORF Transcript_139520/g.256591 Transcript_139520/m.256591 type:complete len:835 (+) Transcript_139520:133-2637(+)
MRAGRGARRGKGLERKERLGDITKGPGGRSKADSPSVAQRSKGSFFSRLTSRPAKRRTNKLSLERDEEDTTDLKPYTPPTSAGSARPGTADSFRNMMSMLRPSTPQFLSEDDSDEEDEEMKAEFIGRRLRDSVHMQRIKVKEMDSKRERGFLNLGTMEYPPPGKERGLLWLQRKTGILELRVRLQIEEMRLEEQDHAYFRDIHEIVHTVKFEAFFGLLILLNAVCIGWDTFYLPDERRPAILDISEHFFTIMFLLEFILRVMADTWLWFCSFVNLFDTFLIFGPGVLLTWILLPLGLPVHAYRRFAALRILRLARLCKVMRIMRAFKELWMLVQGVLDCSTLLIWVLVIGGMVHFTFAVFLLELVAKADKFKDDEQVQYYFGSTIKAMFTLFQLMTFDNGWSGIVRPICDKMPETYFIFGLFMGLCGIVLVNLMTSIVIRNAYDAASMDIEAVATAKQQDQQRVRAELMETFQDLDEDGSGALSQEEFNDCLDDYLFVRKMKLLDIDLEELPDFFDILDDGDGQVDQEEFIGGMMKMQGKAMNCDVLKANTWMKMQNAHFNRLSETFVTDALETYTRMEGDVDRIHSGMNNIMQLTAEVMMKLDELGVRRILKSTMKDLPFVDEPEIKDLAKADKRHAAAQRRGQKIQVEDDIEDQVPAQAKLEKTVPPSWIIREGRSHAAKNPGKLMLQKDPFLKDKIKSKDGKNAKKRIEPPIAPGLRAELSKKWNRMDIPLTEFSTLRTTASEEDGTLVPETRMTPLVNSMSQVLVGPSVNNRQAGSATPGSRSPSAASNSAQPRLQSQVSVISLTPDGQRRDEASGKLQHPHAVPADTVF